MQIPKDEILKFLRERGDDDKAAQAQQELPDSVDTDEHAGLLDRLGINPQELIGRVGGALGL